jgi:hypothetical protein
VHLYGRVDHETRDVTFIDDVVDRPWGEDWQLATGDQELLLRSGKDK